MKYLIPLFTLLLIAGCGGSDNSETEKVKFEQVGYFKSPDNLRYYTFYVKTDLDNNNEVEYSELKKIVEKHGSELMNTSGKVTVGFYYDDKINTPNITNYSAERANEVAHEMKPMFAVWNYGNGQIKLIENPE